MYMFCRFHIGVTYMCACLCACMRTAYLSKWRAAHPCVPVIVVQAGCEYTRVAWAWVCIPLAGVGKH